MSERIDNKLIELKNWLELQDPVLKAHFKPIINQLSEQAETEGGGLGELEALQQIADFEMRKFILDQIDRKKALQTVLDEESISPIKEKQYTEAIQIVNANIKKFQVSGIDEDLI